jgi:hypothetical protein
MTTPRKQPSCEHLAIVTVNAPHQIVHDGVVYLDRDTITDVPKTTAQEWIAHGWAEDATGKDNTPAKKPRQAKNSHRASAEME